MIPRHVRRVVRLGENDLLVLIKRLLNLAMKLAKISHYIVQVNGLLTRLLAQRTLRREVLEQAVDRRMAAGAGDGRRMAQALRRAALIHDTAPLMALKTEVMEAQAQIEALGQVKESLDVLWRTCSRIISARLKEPLE